MRQTFFAAALLAVAVAVNAADAPAGASILHAKLTPAAWAARYLTFKGPDRRMKTNQVLPHIEVYDKEGRLLVQRRGYSQGVASWLATVLEQQPGSGAPLLSELAKDLLTPDGNKFPPVLGHEEPIIVVFGAAWCHPCQALKADLQKVPDITILDVDVDQAKMNWQQIMEAVQKPAAH